MTVTPPGTPKKENESNGSPTKKLKQEESETATVAEMEQAHHSSNYFLGFKVSKTDGKLEYKPYKIQYNQNQTEEAIAYMFSRLQEPRTNEIHAAIQNVKISDSWVALEFDEVYPLGGEFLREACTETTRPHGEIGFIVDSSSQGNLSFEHWVGYKIEYNSPGLNYRTKICRNAKTRRRSSVERSQGRHQTDLNFANRGWLHEPGTYSVHAVWDTIAPDVIKHLTFHETNEARIAVFIKESVVENNE